MHLFLVLFLSSLATLATAHYVAIEFFLYWKHEWLDVPMHLIGGVSIALGIASLSFFRITPPRFFTTWKGHLVAVLIVGTVWEIFEYASGVSILDEHFIPDTALDYVMDVVGVLAGYGIVKTIKSLE